MYPYFVRLFIYCPLDIYSSWVNAIIRNVSLIYSAMSNRVDNEAHTPHKIKFKYLTYSSKDYSSLVERHNGKEYIVNPFKLLVDSGNYYLLAYVDGDDFIRTFRVDRMKQIKELNDQRTGNKYFESIDMANYTKRVFTMFGGEKTNISISFSNDLLDTVIDRFGLTSDVMYQPDDEEHFKLITTVEISSQFFGWLSGFGTKAKITFPKTVCVEYRDYLKSIYKLYD